MHSSKERLGVLACGVFAFQHELLPGLLRLVTGLARRELGLSQGLALEQR